MTSSARAMPKKVTSGARGSGVGLGLGVGLGTIAVVTVAVTVPVGIPVAVRVGVGELATGDPVGGCVAVNVGVAVAVASAVDMGVAVDVGGALPLPSSPASQPSKKHRPSTGTTAKCRIIAVPPLRSFMCFEG
jgi:hypothetical protein